MKLGPPFFGIIAYWLSWPGLKMVLSRTRRTRAIIEFHDEIVVTKAWLGNGKWSLPGGGIKSNESETMALIRELHEEVGLVITEGQMKKLGDYRYRHNGLDFPFVLYSVSIPHKLALRPNRSEVIQTRWIKIADLNASNASSDVLQAINRAQH